MIHSFPLGEIVWEHISYGDASRTPCTTRTQDVKDCEARSLAYQRYVYDHLVLTQESVLIRLPIVLMSGYAG